jgi:integrase/recombinase XerD
MHSRIPELKRKEISCYKPSDIWTQDDDLLFLKWATNKRDRCYHTMSRDLSARPHEILNLRIKDVVLKNANGYQYAEVLVNGKTGSRHIPLIQSIPYIKEWLSNHPSRNNPKSPLFVGLDSHNINPYIRRHSALTEKSTKLKSNILNQHAGWTMDSNMQQKYLHYFGNESSESLLEAYGIVTKNNVPIDTLNPKICPNCSEGNTQDVKFCSKCKMIMSYEGYQEALESQSKKEDELKIMKEQFNTMQSQMQALITAIGTIDRPGKKEIAKQLIGKGMYAPAEYQ